MATRPNTLTLSFTPVLVGAAIHAKTSGSMTVATPAWFWLFACLIQIGTNLHNDYADFVKGADTKDRLGQPRATQMGWLTPRQTATGAALALALAALIGFSLAMRPGCALFMTFVTVTSVFNAITYTGLPGFDWISVSYVGLGDFFVLAYFGFVATFAPFYLCMPWPPLRPPPPDLALAATSLGFLATGVLVVNNLRDRTTDVLVDKKTLAVRFGQTFARIEYVSLVAGAYAVLAAAVAIGGLPPSWLVIFASAPLAVSRLRVARPPSRAGGTTARSPQQGLRRAQSPRRRYRQVRLRDARASARRPLPSQAPACLWILPARRHTPRPLATEILVHKSGEGCAVVPPNTSLLYMSSVAAMSSDAKEVSDSEAIRIFQQMKREAQMMIAKISELEYELGEHELVETNISELDPDRAAFRLVGSVLIRQTVGEVLPKVKAHRENIATTIERLRAALAEKNTKAAEWKAKYGIKTQQEHEVEQRSRSAQEAAAKAEGQDKPGSSTGVLA